MKMILYSRLVLIEVLSPVVSAQSTQKGAAKPPQPLVRVQPNVGESSHSMFQPRVEVKSAYCDPFGIALA